MWPLRKKRMNIETDLFSSIELLRLRLSLHYRRAAVTGLLLCIFLKGNPTILHEQAEVNDKHHWRQEAKHHSSSLHRCVSIVWSKNDGGDEEQHSDDSGVHEVQGGPAGDACPGVQRGGEEDEEQQGEEESCAADKLKEVEGATADAAVHHLLHDEGHEGQQHFEDFDDEVDFIQILWWDGEPGGFGVRSRRRGVNAFGHDGALGSLPADTNTKFPTATFNFNSSLCFSAGQRTSTKLPRFLF